MCSNFSDVFDEDHFINTLANDVKVIKKFPKEMATATRAVKHFRSWSGMDYYENEIASLWEDYQVCFLECSGASVFVDLCFGSQSTYIFFSFCLLHVFFLYHRLFELPSLILA